MIKIVAMVSKLAPARLEASGCAVTTTIRLESGATLSAYGCVFGATAPRLACQSMADMLRIRLSWAGVDAL